MATTPYDYIIAGAGAAGLSLAYRLTLSPALSSKRILLLDKDPKNQNDRTWCFWEAGKGPFEHLLFKEWHKVQYHDVGFSETLNIAPYTYKMIRGIDFYNHIKAHLKQFPNVEFKQASIAEMITEGEGVKVTTDLGEFHGQWGFNSLLPEGALAQQPGYYVLLQHFKGWIIETQRPVFTPDLPTFMDFRMDQGGDCRFGYVLPFSESKALVEYTLFSPSLLTDSEYEQGLKTYLAQHLNLHDGEYTIEEEEFGIIPMTDLPLTQRHSERIVNLGTVGGMTKPSTGYTFSRVQRHVGSIIEQLEAKDTPILPHNHYWPKRFGTYDSTLLNVFAHNTVPPHQVFTNLFKKNPASRILRFLDDDTHFGQEVLVMASVPMFPFAKAMFSTFVR